MRLGYAKWLLDFVEQHGLTLERGEYAEWEEAAFRVYGPDRLPRAEVLPITSDVAIDDRVLSWEPDVLVGTAHELVGALVVSEKAGGDDEP